MILIVNIIGENAINTPGMESKCPKNALAYPCLQLKKAPESLLEKIQELIHK
jgi:hypothetical protein